MNAMTVRELRAALDRMVAADPRLDEAAVTCGSDFQPVKGGAFAQDIMTGQTVLNLAPLKLDNVGGF